MDDTEKCSTLAFYGFRPAAARMRLFFDSLVDWFEELGTHPDEIVVGRPKLGDLVGPLSTVRAELTESGFPGVESLDISASPLESGVPLLNFRATGVCNNGDFAIVSVRESLATLSDGPMLSIAMSLAKSLEPAYGIGYVRNLRLGPTAYAYGVLYGILIEEFDDDSEEYERCLQISRWGNIGIVGKVYVRGVLRDIYPWNFLNAAQRSVLVGDRSLEEWIRQDEVRGRIRPVTRELSLWEVDDVNREGIVGELKPFRIIFDYHDYLEEEIDLQSGEVYGGPRDQT